MQTILFICTGNTCRSSMAEGLFNAAAQKDSKIASQYIAESAGIYAAQGDLASPNAIKVLMDQWKLDLTLHRSRPLNQALLKQASLLLTMTQAHKAALLANFPMFRDKTFTLKEFVLGNADHASQNFDILDPFGGSEAEYRQCAVEIKTAIDKLLVKLSNCNLL